MTSTFKDFMQDHVWGKDFEDHTENHSIKATILELREFQYMYAFEILDDDGYGYPFDVEDMNDWSDNVVVSEAYSAYVPKLVLDYALGQLIDIETDES